MKLMLQIEMNNITGDTRDVASQQMNILKTRLQRLQEEEANICLELQRK